MGDRPTSLSSWTIKQMDFSENAPDEDDEEGSTEVEKGRLLFCHMISSTEILAKILQTLYSVRAEQDLRDADTRLAFGKVEPFS